LVGGSAFDQCRNDMARSIGEIAIHPISISIRPLQTDAYRHGDRAAIGYVTELSAMPPNSRWTAVTCGEQVIQPTVDLAEGR